MYFNFEIVGKSLYATHKIPISTRGLSGALDEKHLLYAFVV